MSVPSGWERSGSPEGDGQEGAARLRNFRGGGRGEGHVRASDPRVAFPAVVSCLSAQVTGQRQAREVHREASEADGDVQGRGGERSHPPSASPSFPWLSMQLPGALAFDKKGESPFPPVGGGGGAKVVGVSYQSAKVRQLAKPG